jgi:hypothetical protein
MYHALATGSHALQLAGDTKSSAESIQEKSSNMINTNYTEKWELIPSTRADTGPPSTDGPYI